MLLVPAVCHHQRFAASKMAEICVSCSTRVDQSSKVNPPGNKFCFKSGSKAAEISYQSARISTPEDERASSFSSTQSLSQYLASKAEKAEDINLTNQTTKPVLKGTSTIQDPRSSPVFAKPLRSYRSHGTHQESVQWYLNPLSSK